MSQQWIVTARDAHARGKRRFVVEAQNGSGATYKGEQALREVVPRWHEWYIAGVRRAWGVRAVWEAALQMVRAVWDKGSDQVRELLWLREKDVFAVAFDTAIAEQEKKVKMQTLLIEYWDGAKEEKVLQHPTGKARWILVRDRG